MANIQDKDQILASLLNLGFDFEICQNALQACDTIEDATEWILSAQDPGAGNPILRLGPSIATTTASQSYDLTPSYGTLDASPTLAQTQRFFTHPTSSLPLSKPLSESQLLPLHSRHEDPDDDEYTRETKEKVAKLMQEAKKQKNFEREAHRRALLQIKEDREKVKIRRVHGPGEGAESAAQSSSSSSSRPVSTVAERLAQEQKRQKILEREAHRRALLEIKADRETLRNRSHQVVSAPTQPLPTLSQPVRSSDTASIQIRFPDGTSQRQAFSVATTLTVLFAMVGQKVVGEVELVSPFPRRVFTVADEELTLQEAGLSPSASLNVMLKQSDQAPFVTPVALTPVQSSVPEQNSRLDTDEDETANQYPMPMEEDTEPTTLLPQPPVLSLPPLPIPSIFPLALGAGHRLVDDDVANDSDSAPAAVSTVNVRAPNADREMWLQSMQASATRMPKAGIKHQTRPLREVSKLKDLCTTVVAGLLTSSTTTAKAYLHALPGASSGVTELLLARLIETRKLDRIVLAGLVNHCYLPTVKLDSYTLATDSLLDTLGTSQSAQAVAKLSLRGCDVITDKGVAALEGLRNLEHLDLSNCKITDKAIPTLAKFSALQTLIVAKTKITTIGLRKFAAESAASSSLQSLDLKGCMNVDGKEVFVALQALKALIHLSLASTPLQPSQQVPTVRGAFSRVEILDVSNTGLADQDIVRIVCGFRELRELRLVGCANVGREGLMWIAKELQNLNHIQFPNREQELDDTLKQFTHVPLTHLDLTGFLNVTDKGVQAIGEIKTLEFLGLEGTKITDAGLEGFQGLTELRELYLDRTAVSDAGVGYLLGLPYLQTLSLSRTLITNASLARIGDQTQAMFARGLRNLNLAGCSEVSDRGVKGLKGLINLHKLNLDHTDVSQNCLRYLEVLSQLQPVRLTGITKLIDEDDKDND